MIRIIQIQVVSFLIVINGLGVHSVWVGESQSIKTIREGLAMVSDGDSLFIEGGHYKEGNIVISKSISIFGINRPVIDGEEKYEILTVSGRNILIKGLKLIYSGVSSMNDLSAIKCIDADSVVVEDNIIEHSFFGIHLANATHITVRNNLIRGYPKTEQNTGNGVHMWKCTNIVVEDNDIFGHRDGIYLEFVTESIIRCNYSHKNLRYGLHFMFSHNDLYEENFFVENGAGVAVMYSKEVMMLNNYFLKNWGNASYGILLKDLTDSHIRGNQFSKNTVGIYMEGTSRTHVEQNNFSENGWAMKVQASCNAGSFRYNNFSRNSFDISTNGTMVLNLFEKNYWDKYDGYDRTGDGIGDIPYHPVSLYSMIVEQNPCTLILLRSILISFLDKAEKAIPSLTPENLKDSKPVIRPYIL